MMDGCLAVNVIGNNGITCELTTGLSNETEMKDDHNSQLFVLSKLYVPLKEEMSNHWVIHTIVDDQFRPINNLLCLYCRHFDHLDYNKCVEEPGLCLNGATCERTWTSARCHCPDRYQGDRCDNCTERFQGEDCDQCADGYYGDSCGKYILIKGFQVTV